MRPPFAAALGAALPAIFLLAQETGWSLKELLSLPVALVEPLLDLALRARGVDPDHTLVGDAPAELSFDPALEAKLRSLLQHG